MVLQSDGFQHFDSQSTNISYLEIGLKPAVFGCFTNAIAFTLIVLQSCSNPQMIQEVRCFALEKNVLVGGCGFFVSDIISEVVCGPFWLMLPGLGLKR